MAGRQTAAEIVSRCRRRQRARIERQTAVVHAAAAGGRRVVLEEATVVGTPYLEAEQERLEIQALLVAAGLL